MAQVDTQNSVNSIKKALITILRIIFDRFTSMMSEYEYIWNILLKY